MSIRKRARTLESIVEKHWSDWSIESGGKHLKLTLRLGEHRRVLTAPVSPSDRRALANWQTQLKQKIRELKEAAHA